MIPYDRFAEVNAQKRAAELKVQELETERQKLMASQQQGSNVNPADPTTDAENAYWKKRLNVVEPDAILSKVEERLKKSEEDRVNQENARKLGEQLTQLRSKYNGEDGILPKFDDNEVIAYATQNGIWNPEVAYKELHFDKFVQKSIKDNSDKPTFVESPSSPGSVAPKAPNGTKEWKDLSVDEMEAQLKATGAWQTSTTF